MGKFTQTHPICSLLVTLIQGCSDLLFKGIRKDWASWFRPFCASLFSACLQGEWHLVCFLFWLKLSDWLTPSILLSPWKGAGRENGSKVVYFNSSISKYFTYRSKAMTSIQLFIIVKLIFWWKYLCLIQNLKEIDRLLPIWPFSSLALKKSILTLSSLVLGK